MTPVAAPSLPLSSIRLGGGAFADAAARNARWLLSLDPDRLLHRFRTHAGLQPKAPQYLGWEKDGVSGHTLGHYLKACSNAAAGGDTEFIARVDYIVSELRECQMARGSGYVGGIPDEDAVFERLSRGEIEAEAFALNGGFVPWYTLHKVLAGLVAAHDVAGRPGALEIAVDFVDWIGRTVEALTHEQLQEMLKCEYGGINEAIADVAALSGDPSHLSLSLLFTEDRVLEPLGHGVDMLEGRHGNTLVAKALGFARQFELTGDELRKRAVEFLWETIVRDHSYVIGGATHHEHFGRPGDLSDRLSLENAEGCLSYNLLKLTTHLHSWNPSARYMDYYERVLFNHILASQHPQSGMVSYYMPLAPGSRKHFSSPDSDFWCCVGTGMENHSSYGNTLAAEQGADTVYVNLYIPAEIDCSAAGLKLVVATDGALSSSASVRISESMSKEVDLRFRVPGWALSDWSVHLNGDPLDSVTESDGYVSVRRIWSVGDVATVTMPAGIRFENLAGSDRFAAAMVGPLVLAELHPEIQAPQLRSGERTLFPTGKPGLYRADIDGATAAYYVPYHSIGDEPHSVYFERSVSSGSRPDSGGVVVDEVFFDANASTLVDHGFVGDRVRWVPSHPRRRSVQAVDGGSFSVQLRASGENILEVEAWGVHPLEASGSYEILVDDVVVATPTIHDDSAPFERYRAPFRASYPLAGQWPGDGELRTVTFRAVADGATDKIFACRLLLK